jgi:hypothetical protein
MYLAKWGTRAIIREIEEQRFAVRTGEIGKAGRVAPRRPMSIEARMSRPN